MRPKSITDEQIKKMVALYQAGVTIKRIMADTGIRSEQTVYRLLRENNISKRPKKVKTKITFIATSEVANILANFEEPSDIINQAIIALYAKES